MWARRKISSFVLPHTMPGIFSYAFFFISWFSALLLFFFKERRPLCCRTVYSWLRSDLELPLVCMTFFSRRRYTCYHEEGSTWYELACSLASVFLKRLNWSFLLWTLGFCNVLYIFWATATACLMAYRATGLTSGNETYVWLFSTLEFDWMSVRAILGKVYCTVFLTICDPVTLNKITLFLSIISFIAET